VIEEGKAGDLFEMIIIINILELRVPPVTVIPVFENPQTM
jgi:hypothetical protein